jgi:hypothetical protein
LIIALNLYGDVFRFSRFSELKETGTLYRDTRDKKG